MEYQDLNKIIDRLIELGEDKEELDYWRDIFPDLNEDKQKEVYDLFKMELEKLLNLQQS